MTYVCFQGGSSLGPSPSKPSPPCQASGGPPQDVKLWIRIQSGRGSMLESAISPTRQSAFLVCLLFIWRGGKKEVAVAVAVAVGAADRQARAQLSRLSCLEVDHRITTSFACISAACIGGVDGDQPEYQRCEAGMTSPGCACPLPLPLPQPGLTTSLSQPQQGRPNVLAGSQPDSGRELDTSLEPTSRKTLEEGGGLHGGFRLSLVP